jgi:hypothetical protein
VLSQERTGSTAVSRSLKALLGHDRVVQVHYLDGSAYRRPTHNPGKLESFADKAEREAKVRGWLSDPHWNGVVFSIVRDPAARIASSIWIKNTAQLLEHHDPAHRTFGDEVMPVIAAALNEAVEKQANYGADVFTQLGLPASPMPGTYRTRSGARAFVLDFDRLADDFTRATEVAFGEAVPLMRAPNGADRYGDLAAYADFRRYCAGLLQTRRLVTPS